MDEAQKSTLQALVSSLSRVRQSSDYADLTIRCGGREWKTHKVIVASQSDFFKKAIDGAFQEGLTGVIELKDEKPDDIQRLLQYMYTADYDEVLKPDRTLSRKASGKIDLRPNQTAPMTHVIMYSLADKFGVAAMKDLCKQKFLLVAKKFPSNDAFWDALEAIETTTPEIDRGLRDAAIDVLHGRSYTLFRHDRFDEYMRKHSEVAPALLKKANLEREESLKHEYAKSSHRCSWCKRTTPISKISVIYGVPAPYDQKHQFICDICRIAYTYEDES